jgi:hypothetical protein
MTNDKNNDNSSTDPQNEPFPQSPSAASGPQQQGVAEYADSHAELPKDETKEPGKGSRTVEKRQMAINIALCIVGVTALAIYYGQLRQMKRVIDATQRVAEAAGKSSEAAKASVDLAQKSLQTTINTFRLNARAWLYVSPMSKPLKANEAVMVVIHGQNSGKTAARKVQGVGVAEILEGGRQPDFIYRHGHPRALFSGNILEPDSTFDFQTFVMKEGAAEPVIQRLTESQLQTINTRKATLFTHGEISFQDVFGDEHWVKFCFVYIPSGYVLREIAHFGIPDEGACKEHNDMDDSK